MMVDKAPNSLSILNQMNRIDQAQGKAIQRIASGKQILTAGDDPAGLSVAMTMESQFRGIAREIANRQDEISLVQTAEGGVSQITEAVQRMRELSIQAANGTLTDSDRQAIQLEINQLNEHVNMVSTNTEYNTKKLLDGTLEVSLQNGSKLKVPNMASAALGTSGINVTDTSGANAAIGQADQAINTTVSQRAEFGAVINGISAEVSSLNQQMLDTMAAQSRIADADMAAQIIELSKTQLQSQAAISVFRTDDAMRGQVLKLLGE
jgi:flagellin